MLSVSFPVVRIEKWWKVVLVVFQGCRPRFMSRAAFLKHFVEWRKAQALALRVTQRVDVGIGLRPAEGVQFTVWNESKNSAYIVQAMPSALLCECEDYKNQIQFLGKGCCKHGYAVLAHLGFGSLQNYIAALGENGYLRSRTG